MMCNAQIRKIKADLECPPHDAGVEYRVSQGILDATASQIRRENIRAAKAIDSALLRIAKRSEESDSRAGYIMINNLKLRWRIVDCEHDATTRRRAKAVGHEQFLFRMWIHGERPSWPDVAPRQTQAVDFKEVPHIRIGERRGATIVLGFATLERQSRKYRTICGCGRIEAKSLQQLKRVNFLCAKCRGAWCVTCGAFMISGKGACTVNCSPECSTAYRKKYFQIYKAAKYKMTRSGTASQLGVDATALQDIATLGHMMEKSDG